MRRTKRVQTRTKLEEDEPVKLGFQGWGPLMKKFSEDNKIECKALEVSRLAQTTEKQFPTGAKFEGTADILGMAGYGTYTLPNGVIYEGDFEDGMFQGDGTLTYPSGIIIKGIWNKGAMTERVLYFADGLRYSEDDWDYCKMPDRRFSVEYDLGLQPAGNSLLTADQPTREIPPGHYDTSDGFFDCRAKSIFKADDPTVLIRCPLEKEQKWIIDNCRVHGEVHLGPRGHLYEEWSEPELDYGEMKMSEAKVASGASKIWGFEGEKEFPLDGTNVVVAFRPNRETVERYNDELVSCAGGLVKCGQFEGYIDVKDDGWRLKFSQSKARLSIVATRSVAEFGARQQKTRFKWGDISVAD